MQPDREGGEALEGGEPELEAVQAELEGLTIEVEREREGSVG
jgi:hypothetical protein